MVNFVNLTPHKIKIISKDGEVMEIPPSGKVARIVTKVEKTVKINEINIKILKKAEIKDLPEPKENVIYIASAMVAEAATLQGRFDVVAPDTGAAIRDANGNIIGVPGLVQYMP